MIKLFKTNIGRLRVLGFLEGFTLILLVFVAVPLKYCLGLPWLTKMLGPIHGAIFLLFLINTFSVAVEESWKFRGTTWKIILACFIPFGTFYIDKTILSRMKSHE
jgi:integral membrane protein